MPYRPACPKLSASQHGDDRNLAMQKRRWPGLRPRLCSDGNRRHFALDDGGSMPRFGHVQASYFPPRRCREEHCEALRLGHLQLLLLKMALLSPAAPVRRRHPHAPTTRAHRGRRIQAESRASEKKHRGPLADAPGRFWAAPNSPCAFPQMYPRNSAACKASLPDRADSAGRELLLAAGGPTQCDVV